MRRSGVLMHISSLPSPYGIGTMGEEAYRYVDFLKNAGQSYWQILPINQTSYGDSPYQSFSAFAGNPYFIDLDMLCEEGYLTKEECESYTWGNDEETVDYAVLYENRYAILKKVYKKFTENIPTDYRSFCKEQEDWLEDYALFMALKDAHGGISWQEWEPELKARNALVMEIVRDEHEETISFWKMIQYLFFKQWKALKSYANEQGIEIIGDVPIYVAADSADVWTNPGQFYLDEELNLIDVAGCPPDAFSADGQLWGNPLFNWSNMEADDYAWWTKRIAYVAKLYDVVRIDHFRGFESYYAIPAKAKTAANGEWREGPGVQLFKRLEEKLGKLPIIVEDLGFLTDEVIQMVADSGYPGMKVIQFAFDSRESGDYLPHNYEKHCVVYTGTHDNDTILGWFDTAPEASVKYAIEYLRLTKEEGYHWGMMKSVWASTGELAVVTMQDLLGLGSEARMNIPSTIGTNWRWRMKKEAATDELAEKLFKNMTVYQRAKA